ncbi:MAG: Rpn family recombination-promoting nuclease/putative transposase [Polyangiaceae bacterium]|nr:Rpn family recombination-promoting nuclease/putative transposase [Polyangiaceae bacterium]
MSNQPHDGLVRAVFSHPEHARGELELLLPKEVSTHVDWSTLTLVPGAFVDEALQSNYSDLLYSVKFQGKEGFIYVLWEHQSSPDRFLIFRELKYVVRFLDNWLVDHPNATHLPIVIPVVLAHGRRPWTCPLSFEDLLDIPAELKPAIIDYVPRFRVLLDDLYHETDEGLRSRSLSTLAAVTLWCLKNAFNTPELLRTVVHWRMLLRALHASNGGADWLQQIFLYITAVHEEPTETVLPALAKSLEVEENQTMATIQEQLIEKGVKKGLEQGLAQGLEQGLEKGLAQGQRATLYKQLQRKFGDRAEAVKGRIDAAAPAEVDTWLDRILFATTLDEVFTE